MKKHTTQLVIHCTAWALVFAFPIMLFWRNTGNPMPNFWLHNVTSLLSLLCTFYINYFLLIKKFLFKKKYTCFFVSNTVFILIIALGFHFIKESMHANPPRIGSDTDIMHAINFISRDIISLITVAGLAVAIKMTEKWNDMERAEQEAEHQRSEAELANLRQQLNPHFLFNTLNNIYVLTAIDTDKAQTSILELSKLLRYVLYDNDQKFVPLAQELEFVKNYVELMRLRLADNIELKFNINVPDAPNYNIAPLLFISLIENAFKHGVSPDLHSFVHIDINTKTTADNKKMLHCQIANSYFPKTATDNSGSGIGLENMRRRMELLYGNTAQMTTKVEADTYLSEMNVPLNISQTTAV